MKGTRSASVDVLDVHAGAPVTRRPGRRVAGPVDRQRIGAGFGERQALLVPLAPGMGVGDLPGTRPAPPSIVGRRGLRWAGAAAETIADRAARVSHVDGLTRAGSWGGSSPPCGPGSSSPRRSAAAGRSPSRSISAATKHISSSEGVMRPLRPDDVDLVLARRATSRIRLAAGDHHAEVDDVVVVAGEHDADDVLADVVDVALHGRHQDLSGRAAWRRCHRRRRCGASRLGHVRFRSTATACFITRADFTTCGRNILPEPNRSPTTFMPAISGPSITSSGRAEAAWRASSVSASTKSVMPLTSACSSRLATGASRQAQRHLALAALGTACP